MQSKVKVIPDENGAVIRVSSNNPEFGHVRLQQKRSTIGFNGWVRMTNLSTLLHGKVEDLQEMGMADIKELPGKIIIKESTEPFSTTDPDRDLKIAGETGIVCCVDGEPIYRKTFYVPTEDAEDILIAHTNGEAIRQANGKVTASIEETIRPPKVIKTIKEEIPVEITSENSDDIQMNEPPEFEI